MCKYARWEWYVSVGEKLDDCEKDDVRAHEHEKEVLCVL